MAKKKKSNRPVDDKLAATIVFRPGPALGRLIQDLAEQWSQSRGEVAKRLVALAVHDLDFEFVPYAEELMELAYGSLSFDAACQQIHVVITEKSNNKPQLSSRDDKLEYVRQHLNTLRLVRGIESRAERSKVVVKLERR